MLCTPAHTHIDTCTHTSTLVCTTAYVHTQPHMYTHLHTHSLTLQNQFCTLVKFSELSNVQLCRAVVVEPHELGREDCVKFVSSLALCICVNATLYHVKDLCQVAVQVCTGGGRGANYVFFMPFGTKVRFPDGKKLLFVPKPEEVREVGVTEHRLETSVIISHGMWTGMWTGLCTCMEA